MLCNFPSGHLLNRLAEKELCFHIVSNRVQSSILWKMSMPDEDARVSLKLSNLGFSYIGAFIFGFGFTFVFPNVYVNRDVFFFFFYPTLIP